MPSQSFEKVYLLHSHSANYKYHTWGLFIEQSKEVHFFVVGAHSKTSMKQIFVQTLNELEYSIEYGDWEISNTSYFTDLNTCLKTIDQKKHNNKGKNKGTATIVLLQSDYTPEKLFFMGLPTLS